jgi:large conductance mechanosensitive channel
MMNDFKKFILRGNVVDLAVGVVIGSAFGAVVSSLVKDLITPLVGTFSKGKNFSGQHFTVHGSVFNYGDFINALISFLIIAIVIFFFVVQPVNKLVAYSHRRKGAPAITTRPCPECLSDISPQATRCMYCTSKVKPLPLAAVAATPSGRSGRRLRRLSRPK